MPLGFITKVLVERHFGFISTGLDSPEVFFHAEAAEPGLFERLKPGQPVEFDLDEEAARAGQGQRAVAVRRCQ
ncbi:MAG TPA: cold shock domain-containing protein, partial [Pirellulales bacterium]|nr:cold shock domain-containing protein [Pirellulales bacterium]